jgi:Gpi18-like mannosyltransferase/4-amino-4-deoxy-L-arabinose transferase-like glycosyltransferase
MLPVWRDRESGLRGALLFLGGLFIVKTASLALFPGFGPDVSSYTSWALDMALRGPAQIYRSGYFLDYPPGYLYALWPVGAFASAIGATGTTLRILVETPAMLGDLALAATMFAAVRRAASLRSAWIAMLFVALNPALLFDTVVWGQSDSVLAFSLFLAVTAFIDRRFALGWALAAIGLLVKPQALMLFPLFAWLTLLEANPRGWIWSALAGLGVFLAGIAPFQLGQRWDWIVALYTRTAAYYAETSVNAFNLIALLGGLRQPDSTSFLGVSYFALGMSLLAPLYAFVGWVLWRRRDARAVWFASFITIFGFFMLAPRMHERYLYAALVFAAPLALDSIAMLSVFALLTATCLFNLAYVLHTLNTVVFLEPRDSFAMLTAMVNLGAFALPVWWGARGLPADSPSGIGAYIQQLADRFSAASPAASRDPVATALPGWSRADTTIVAVLIAAAAVTRLWNLGHPGEIVFDEVHFVTQARHYLHDEVFLDPHPPLAKLVIAAGIWIFGDQPWSWRVGNALIGVALVAITYLLGRRMLRSRLAGGLASAFILGDGMFLIDSRIAVIDIVYITLAALAYLLLFRFIDERDAVRERLTLLALGVAVGLCVGAKLYVPVFTALLIAGFLLWVLLRATATGDVRARASTAVRNRRAFAALTLVTSVAFAAYLAVFIPHYLLGWWGGISDLIHYYGEVLWYERSVASATHPYSSPWWSWPLMLRPIAYWQNFPKEGDVATIWAGGNPVLWWGALTAITITAVRACERPSLARSFIVVGYVGYLALWVWVGRTLFLYHYLPCAYLGYLALAAVLADCWQGDSEPWEHLAIILTLAPPAILALGVPLALGSLAAILIAYAALLLKSQHAGRLATAVFVLSAVAAFFYFLPLWLAWPIERAGYYQRMWLKGPGLRNWI